MGWGKKKAKDALPERYHKMIDKHFSELDENTPLDKLVKESSLKIGKFHNRRGRREDLGFSCDSSAEANLARIMNFMIYSKEHTRFEVCKRIWPMELHRCTAKDEFLFEKIRKGTRVYIPDFHLTYAYVGGDDTTHYIQEDYYWLEFKGMLDNKSKTRLRRFKKYYPDEFSKLVVFSAPSGKEKIRHELLQKELGYAWVDWAKFKKGWDFLPNWE